MNTFEKIREIDLAQLDVSDLLEAINEMKKYGVIGNDSEIYFSDGEKTYVIDIISASSSDSSKKQIFNLHGKQA